MPFLNQTDVLRRPRHLPTWILLLTVVCWLPYFARTAVPVHDTSYVTESFHCFYRELLCCGELARWFPYGNYGIQADLYQLAMHPTQYAVGSVGLALGVDDTLVLTQIAMLLNEILFALGLWMLSRELYALPATAFLVSACGMLSVSWFEQSMFNFFTFYLLPLVMTLVLRFLKTGKPTLLFLAGIVEVCSLLGNVAYIIPIHFWTLLIFAAPLACAQRHGLKQLLNPRSLLNPWLWIMLSMLVLVGLFFAGAAENLRMLSIGRDATTGKVPLDVFLNHGRPPMIAAIFGLATGGIPHGPNTYYVGLFPVVLFVYALVTERQRSFVGIAAACTALVWLSAGGVFARLIYHLPGMGIFRHIGLTYGISGMLLLLAAGFGIDRLMLRLGDRDVFETRQLRLRQMSLAALALLMLADFWFSRRPGDLTLPDLFPGWKPYLAFRVLVYSAAIPLVLGLLRRREGDTARQPSLRPAMIVGLACLLDVGSFRLQVLESMPVIEQGALADTIFKACRMPYRDMRSQIPVDDRGRTTLDQMGRTLPHCNNAQYGLLCTFAGIDPCRPLYRADIISRGVYEMIVARGGIPTLFPTDDYLPANDDSFKRSIGCGTPKLRLVNQALTTANDAEALRTFSALANPDTAIVLSPGVEVRAESRTIPLTNADDPATLGTVDVTGFSSNRLRVRTLVTHAQPVWLVYADAWHPGWTVKVDGRTTSLLRANLGFKAVELTNGMHDVEFAFSDRKRTILACAIALIGTASGFGLCGMVLFGSVVPRHFTWTWLSR